VTLRKKCPLHTDQVRFPYFHHYDTLPKSANTPVYSETKGLRI